MPKIGYWLSSEEYAPEQLIEQARLAEEAGFDAMWTRPEQGLLDRFRKQSPEGARTEAGFKMAWAESMAAGPDPKNHLEAFQSFRDVGFDDLFANMGPRYADKIRTYGRDVLPEPRGR